MYDIIGPPVNSPYGLVKPDPQLSRPEDFVGKSAYVRDVDLRRRRVVAMVTANKLIKAEKLVCPNCGSTDIVFDPERG